ncbi:hypothetical protein ON010_g1142 [Phytophthora cinnamomi]|nr:hypothetical protein ON010_g1142 [Phytophthora cinnamomi]
MALKGLDLGAERRGVSDALVALDRANGVQKFQKLCQIKCAGTTHDAGLRMDCVDRQAGDPGRTELREDDFTNVTPA